MKKLEEEITNLEERNGNKRQIEAEMGNKVREERMKMVRVSGR